MRKRKLILFIFGLCSSLLVTTTLMAIDEVKSEQTKETKETKEAPLPDPVAVVNGTPIPKVLYEAYSQQRQMQRGSGANTPETRKSLTDELVIQELLVQEARKQNLDKEAQFAQQMEMVRRNLLASTAVRKALSEKPISEEAIKKEYETTKASMAKKEYKARHILVDSEDKAKDLIKQIKGGADFSELAKANSTDSSGANGGDLGWFTTDMMVEPFGEAVTKLDKGKFTQEPVKTEFGWHIILLDDIRDATPPSLEEMRPQISQALQSRVLNDYLEKLRSGAKVEIK